MAAGNFLRERLASILGAVTRDQVGFAWLRRQLADPGVLTEDITSTLRELGWRQSFSCRRDGRPRHYWRDATAAPRPMPTPIEDGPEARAEYAALGLYIHGEPRDKTLRRAALKRAMRSGAGCYSDPDPIPETQEDLELELCSIGAHQLGEPGRRSRRRAALVRALRKFA